jgi:LEA14-like dessication related protein
MNVNPANLRGLITNKKLDKMLLKWLGIFGCLSLLFACQKPLVPDYLGFINPHLDKTDLQGSLVSANVKFYNPNGFGLKLKRVDMDISLNGKLANHYLLDSTIVIQKKDTFYIPVSIKLDLKNLLSNALQIFMSKQVKITLEGKVKLKRGIIPFTRHFHFEVNQPMDSLMKLIN